MQPARPNISSRSRRRGVTLLEMLVTVALLLIMMLIIVSIFQAATGAITVSRAFTLLDQDLRRLDTTIRQDLQGVEAIMTPPGVIPNDTRPRAGYFEYAENALSDAQDEDSDDTLRFTAKAPPGRPFTGRMWVRTSLPDVAEFVTTVPIPVTSQFAEIIYFQRGDKLYRRVRLILQGNLGGSVGNFPYDAQPKRTGFVTSLFEPKDLFPPAFKIGTEPFVSWQGLNDVSARPSRFLPGTYYPQFNSLADLADRHNRFASPRFADDYRDNTNPAILVPDGLPDDTNGDGVADYYPTMYPRSKLLGYVNDSYAPQGPFPNNNARLPYPDYPDLYGFPYVFPNAFTGSDPVANQLAVGRIHAPDVNPTARERTFNHNPLLSGDSLPVPSPDGRHTWWGFPTWRETMAPTWLDPIRRINDPRNATFSAPYFNDPAAQAIGEDVYQQFKGLSPYASVTPLPKQLDQPFSDGKPATSVFDLGNAPVFEDDLIAVNVRSFNIKAYDPNRYARSDNGTPNNPNDDVVLLNPATGEPISDPGYEDLGYASTRYSGYSSVTQTPPWMLSTLGHEGRLPPLPRDFRVDAQYPTYISDPTTTPPTVSPSFLGDDNASVVRLRRTWDSWSTTYTKAPALPLDPSTSGPLNGGRAVMPSYPSPYPVPMRGIEIQIRITDPGSRYIKTLTIRQDFADKL